MRRFSVALALLCAGLPANNLYAKAAQIVLSTEDSAAADVSVQRGEMLWTMDQAAWHTTDAMLADMNEDLAKQILGWVVTKDTRGWLVVYYGIASGDGAYGVYSAIWTGEGSEVVDGGWIQKGDYVFNAEQENLIAAGDIAAPNSLEKCNRANLNRVIMVDPTDSSQILVYYMTPQIDRRIPFGKHYRFTVRDGESVELFEPTKSCIALPVSTEGDERPVAMGITNLVSKIPTEFHVFGSKMANILLVVMNKNDLPQFKVGWKNEHAYITPISSFDDLDDD